MRGYHGDGKFGMPACQLWAVEVNRPCQSVLRTQGISGSWIENQQAVSSLMNLSRSSLMKKHFMLPTQAAHEEAKRNPNGYVYSIDGQYGPDDAVPPERIAGCWKVDAKGRICGEFIPNPNYRPRKD